MYDEAIGQKATDKPLIPANKASCLKNNSSKPLKINTSKAPIPKIRIGKNKGRIIIGIIKPWILSDKIRLDPIHPIKLNAGVPIIRVISIGMMISESRLTKIPIIGVIIIIGRQFANQCEIDLINENP